jgi:hypothetical protein
MKIKVSGEAANGGIMGDRIGEIGGSAVPAGNSLVISTAGEESCEVTLRLLWHYLSVDDTGHCGPNVGDRNFTGLYIKAQPQKP